MARSERHAIIITGVVDGVGGGGGAQMQGKTSWTGSFHLAVWRETGADGTGPVQTNTLRVEIPDQRQDQLDKWARIFPARTLVRFAIREPVRDVNGCAFAELKQPLPRAEDAELLAAADPILNPPPIIDPQFGTFTADTAFPQWFKQSREWLGRSVNISLELDFAGPPGPDVAQQALATMRGVWDKQEDWDTRIRTAIAEEYYDVWLDNWRKDDEPAIDRDTFKARFALENLSFAPDGSFTYTFSDDDLFWGHAMMVDYIPESDEFHVAMCG